MKRFIEGESRNQASLLPECLDDYIAEDNPVRAVEAFIDELDSWQWDLPVWSLPQRGGLPITRRFC